MSEIITRYPIVDAIHQQEANALAASVREAAHSLDGYAGGWIEDRSLDAILRDLPSYSGQDLVQLVVSLAPDQRRILDLGSGDNAVALSELVSSFNDGTVRGTGVTLPVADRLGVNPPDREYTLTSRNWYNFVAKLRPPCTTLC